jgi:hypothetical protein
MKGNTTLNITSFVQEQYQLLFIWNTFYENFSYMKLAWNDHASWMLQTKSIFHIFSQAPLFRNQDILHWLTVRSFPNQTTAIAPEQSTALSLNCFSLSAKAGCRYDCHATVHLKDIGIPCQIHSRAASQYSYHSLQTVFVSSIYVYLQWTVTVYCQSDKCSVQVHKYMKEYARAEGVPAGFGVDLESASDLSRGIGVSETAECWEKVQRTSARPHVDLVPSGNGTGTCLTRADTWWQGTCLRSLVCTHFCGSFLTFLWP